MLRAISNGAIKLYHDNSQKLATTSSGVDITGNIDLADNGKLLLGNSDDLQIYHDGSHSYIKDVGQGDLTVSGDNLYLEKGDGTKFLYGVSSTGQVRLYYGDAQKFITTSTGVDVTGTVTADGLTSSGDLTISSTYPRINLTDTNNNPDWAIINANGAVHFYDATNAVNRLKVNSTGIDVTGTVNANAFVGDGSALTGLVGGGPSLGTNSIIRTNAKTIAENITFAGTENGMSIGPITVNSGYTVTVTSGSTWVVL
jgi:hypothetical protein